MMWNPVIMAAVAPSVVNGANDGQRLALRLLVAVVGPETDDDDGDDMADGVNWDNNNDNDGNGGDSGSIG